MRMRTNGRIPYDVPDNVIQLGNDALVTGAYEVDVTLDVAEILAVPSTFFLTDVEVPTTAWMLDATYPDYPYVANIPCDGVNASYYPDLVFSMADLTSGIFAPTCATTDKGQIRIWANEVPEVAIIIPSIKLTKVNYEPMSGDGLGTMLIVADDGSTVRAVYDGEEEVVLTATAADIRAGKTALTEDGVVIGTAIGGADIATCAITLTSFKDPETLIYTVCENGEIMAKGWNFDAGNISISTNMTLENVVCGSAIFYNNSYSMNGLTVGGGVEIIKEINTSGGIFRAPIVVGAIGTIDVWDND